MADVETETAHVRSLPSDYVDVQDQSYDPNYISDISKKMQVPEKIMLDDGSGAAEHTSYNDPGSGRQFSAMSVPDRIIVAGDNQHIGLREGLRQLPIDRYPHTEGVPTNVELMTPPRVLTLEQRFPVLDDSDEKHSRESQDRQLAANGHIGGPISYTPGTNPNDSVLVSEEDETMLLRTQVAKLTRRITAIEHDNIGRAQRENCLYMALFGYVLWKLIFSFFRSR